MREIIQLTTHRDQELVDITNEVRAVVARSGVHDGLFQVYAQGATAAIMIQKNWDDSVQEDVIDFLAKQIRRGSGDMTPKTATATPTSRPMPLT
ncbi:YjbQ family protein [Thiocapsa sp.]|uniref:YjbQ family protein n=1 Tax=Thiocapsa sp. TaxID=2024551 RepID=UPI003592F01E